MSTYSRQSVRYTSKPRPIVLNEREPDCVSCFLPEGGDVPAAVMQSAGGGAVPDCQRCHHLIFPPGELYTQVSTQSSQKNRIRTLACPLLAGRIKAHKPLPLHFSKLERPRKINVSKKKKKKVSVISGGSHHADVILGVETMFGVLLLRRH